jgi:hypothetical protein
MASHVSRNESLDIRFAVPNAAPDPDKWTPAPVGPFPVKSPQTAPEELGRLGGSQELGRHVVCLVWRRPT